jgi:hypothetical protein
LPQNKPYAYSKIICWQLSSLAKHISEQRNVYCGSQFGWRKLAYIRLHCNEKPIYVLHFLELRGLSPNFHIHGSVSDL